MPIIAKDSTGNVASLMIYNSSGAPLTGVAHDAAGLAIKSSIRGGAAAAVTVNAGTWTEKDYGQYEVALADALFSAVQIVEIIGVITGGVVVGETLQVVELLAEPAGGIASIDRQTAIQAKVDVLPAVWVVPLSTLGATAPAGWLNAAAFAANSLDGKGNWNIGKTGYSLTATTGLGNQTANITGNLSGSVGSVTTPVTTDTASRDASKATGFATPTNVTDARDAILTQGNLAWITGNTTTPPTVGAIATQVRTELSTELARIDAKVSDDTAGTTTLLTRVVGTLAAGTHNPQSGDVFPIVNSVTHGNPALKTLIDTVDTVVDAITVEVVKIPRKGYRVTGENVTPGGEYLGEMEIVAYTEVEATT